MKRTRTLAGSVALLLFLLLGNCAVENLDDIVVVADVKDEFYLDFWENLSPEGRTFEFRIKTIEEENCTNAYIDHKFHKSASNFAISLSDILQPSNCIPGKAPAQTNIDAGGLKLGVYTFSVDLKNTVFNEGKLTTLNDRYLFKLETENGIRLVRKELFRVPDETIWGYAHYKSPDDELGALQFIEKIQHIGNFVPFKQGYYGHFTIGVGNVIDQVYDQPEDGEVIPFLLEFRGNSTELQDLINQFRVDYGAEVTFRLYNSLGQSF
jgi:hypothetical protein